MERVWEVVRERLASDYDVTTVALAVQAMWVQELCVYCRGDMEEDDDWLDW